MFLQDQRLGMCVFSKFIEQMANKQIKMGDDYI